MAAVTAHSGVASAFIIIFLIASLSHPPPCTAYYLMHSGDILKVGQGLNLGDFTFFMQKDCNLVLYDAGHAIWSSGTSNKGSGCYAKVQSTGNLVIYSSGIILPFPVWKSNNEQRSESRYVLILQADRNVVLYGGKVWGSGTGSSSFFTKNATSSNRIAMVTNNH